ncbi:MAG TPA: hypothetical protein VIO64_13365 [Pseudobacteroides sp.]|uniref:hypothetical protein n=1 Tax=Pseudobacteroides sp. TaxID=1968840 RepID=UPI002F92E728
MGLFDNFLNQIRNFFRPGMVVYEAKENKKTNKIDKKKTAKETKTANAEQPQIKNA